MRRGRRAAADSAQTWDVVVVGARMAGAATAMLLARSGLRVLVLDRARQGADTLSTHALMRTGVVQLHRWGLLDRVAGSGTPAVRRTVFHYDRDRITVSLKQAFGVDALYAPRRTVIDAILADAAAEAGATLQFGWAVTGLLRDGSGRVCGVIARASDGQERHIRAALVVGADGRHSTVAELAQARTTLAGSNAGGYLYGYWHQFESSGYEWFYGPGCASGVIPTNDAATCVFVGEPAARLRERLADGPDRAFTGLATRIGSDLAERLESARRVGRLRVFRGHPGELRNAWGPGWALVGDAGYWKDPISTHGMSDALRDAELLANAVLDAGPASRDEDQALAGYQARRDALSARMIDVVERIAGYEWDTAGVQRLLLELSSTMTDQVEAVVGLDSGDGRRMASVLH